jgi:hypothetical protein
MYDYTADELEVHYEASIRRRAEETRHWGLMIRVATNADKKGWRKYVKRMHNVWKDIEIAAGRFPQPVHAFFGALDQMGRDNDGTDH